MPEPERRFARRMIMKVPLRFRPVQAPANSEREAASMNICNHGVYFATDQRVDEGVMIQVHLKMPREVVGDDVENATGSGWGRRDGMVLHRPRRACPTVRNRK